MADEAGAALGGVLRREEGVRAGDSVEGVGPDNVGFRGDALAQAWSPGAHQRGAWDSAPGCAETPVSFPSTRALSFARDHDQDITGSPFEPNCSTPPATSP